MADLDESDKIRLRNLELQNQEFKHTLEDNTMAVQALTASTADLVKAWQTATYLLTVVQFLAKVAAAVTVLWLMFKGIPSWISELRKPS